VYLQAEALLEKTVTSGLPFKGLPRSLCDSTPFVWVVMGLCINFAQARRAWEEEEADTKALIRVVIRVGNEASAVITCTIVTMAAPTPSIFGDAACLATSLAFASIPLPFAFLLGTGPTFGGCPLGV